MLYWLMCREDEWSDEWMDAWTDSWEEGQMDGMTCWWRDDEPDGQLRRSDGQSYEHTADGMDG